MEERPSQLHLQLNKIHNVFTRYCNCAWDGFSSTFIFNPQWISSVLFQNIFLRICTRTNETISYKQHKHLKSEHIIFAKYLPLQGQRLKIHRKKIQKTLHVLVAAGTSLRVFFQLLHFTQLRPGFHIESIDSLRILDSFSVIDCTLFHHVYFLEWCRPWCSLSHCGHPS